MGIFGKLFRTDTRNKTAAVSNEEAVLIHLDGNGLPEDIYKQNDLDGLEEELASALDGTGLGEIDGHELTPTGATVYLYGSDAEKLFSHIEPAIRAYPLCQNATIVIRKGKPGASQREISL